MLTKPTTSSAHKIDPNHKVFMMQCDKAFNQLGFQDKMYGYYLYKASWAGAHVEFHQRGYGAAPLSYLFAKVFICEPIEDLKEKWLKADESNTNEDWSKIMAYIAGFFEYFGCFISLGQQKFVPDVTKEKFYSFLKTSKFYQIKSTIVDEIWNENSFEMYENTAPHGVTAWPEHGESSYYSNNMLESEAKMVLEFSQSIDLMLENTSLLKLNNRYFVILVINSAAYANNQTSQYHSYKGVTIEIQYGYLGKIMDKLIGYMSQLKNFAKNNMQEKMFDAYIESFKTGCMKKHKESQKYWIQDKGPIIESNIGFVESYIDPQGIRAYWEGFAAIIDIEKSKLCQNLVERGLEFNQKLPWPKDYEKDEFIKPDFTALSLLTFASHSLPIGINIPNYDDIRKSIGFKNVAFDNARGITTKEAIHFTEKKGVDAYFEHFDDLLFTMVTLHEMLGHGSGKLFTEDENGKLNFDKEKVVNPLTNEKAKTWYKPGETWGTVFGSIACAWEECRADSVALYLSCHDEILEVLCPHLKGKFEDLTIAVWTALIMQGFSRITAYDPEAKKWGQAHSQGRYMVCRYLMANGFLNLEKCTKDGKPYFYYTMDYSKIRTEGKKLLGEILVNLNVMKAEANIEKGKVWWDEWTHVPDEMLEIRNIVKEWIPGMPLTNWPTLTLENGDVKYHNPEMSHEGYIKNRLKLFDHEFDDSFEEYQKRKHLFRVK